jgi:hypothetical protein
MANTEQVAILRDKGVREWNNWREAHPDLSPDLNGADLFKADLVGANLTGANLNEANLAEADLNGANLTGAHLSWADFWKADLSVADLSVADLSGAVLSGAYLFAANLSGANLTGADLIMANLNEANLNGADLNGANLTGADLLNTNLEGAILTGARVYGISVWDVKLENAVQTSLVITPDEQPEITVDNLEAAQFIYVLLNNERIRHVLDTITSKVVLILGRFTPERKAILDAIRDELRNRDYLPVVFDFKKPSSKTALEKVSRLAQMSRFVIADITDAKSVLQELQAVVPSNPSVPVQPLLIDSQTEPGMFDFLKKFPWVLEPYLYEGQDLLAKLTEKVIGPAEAKARQQTGRRDQHIAELPKNGDTLALGE